MGLPAGGRWTERLNSDSVEFGGSGRWSGSEITAEPKPFHGREWSAELTLPPLSVVFLQAD